ncbi:MAG: ankyrin repeat domain-containing protein [Hyphomonas sp.]
MSQVKSPMAMLADAVAANDAEKVKGLLAKYPNQREVFTPFAGGTWLHYAAQKGSNEVVKYLLTSGMDVNVRDRSHGTNALCSAADQNRVETVKLLLEKGVVLDTSASVRNPLFAAIVGRSPEVAKLILEAGIDSKVRYNSPTMSDMDAVAFALMQGERECAEIIARWNAAGDEVEVKRILIEADKVAERNVRG